jgi:hypothetical protein
MRRAGARRFTLTQLEAFENAQPVYNSDSSFELNYFLKSEHDESIGGTVCTERPR